MASTHSGLVRVARRADKRSPAGQRATPEVDARLVIVPACVSGTCVQDVRSSHHNAMASLYVIGHGRNVPPHLSLSKHSADPA